MTGILSIIHCGIQLIIVFNGTYTRQEVYFVQIRSYWFLYLDVLLLFLYGHIVSN